MVANTHNKTHKTREEHPVNDAHEYTTHTQNTGTSQ